MNLTISCDGGASAEVVAFAQNYEWRYGKYEVIKQPEQLGVDKHNLACMYLAKDLGHVVVLEDDLTVSPSFQLYLLAIQNLHKVEKQLAGVSLYRYTMVEQDHFPFELIPNDEFVYYQQRASSKGCFYTWSMLEGYFDFLETFDGDFMGYHLPQNVSKWGDEVWEKSFYCYLQKENKYLAFPRFSLTTDFADSGVHMTKQTTKYAHQSKLFVGASFGELRKIMDTENVFDAFYEVDKKTLLAYHPNLEKYDFEVDMYGNKDLSLLQCEYLLSSKKCDDRIYGWERRLKPEINNVLLDSQGDFYSFGRRSDFSSQHGSTSLKEKFLYYYPDTRILDLLKMKWSEVVSRFTK